MIDLKNWRVKTCRCDKCGKVVSCKNCAIMLDLLVDGGATVSVTGFDCGPTTEKVTIRDFCKMERGRHLLRTKKCVGSPSRAQNLPGQPSDSRGFYKPREGKDLENLRAAYARMQQEL